jgi:hypothetical protein
MNYKCIIEHNEFENNVYGSINLRYNWNEINNVYGSINFNWYDLRCAICWWSAYCRLSLLFVWNWGMLLTVESRDWVWDFINWATLLMIITYNLYLGVKSHFLYELNMFLIITFFSVKYFALLNQLFVSFSFVFLLNLLVETWKKVAWHIAQENRLRV